MLRTNQLTGFGAGSVWPGIEYSIDTNGSDEYMTNTFSAADRTEWIFSIWIQTDLLSAQRAIFTCWTASTDTGNFQLETNSTSLRALGWTSVWVTHGTTLSTGTWYHVLVSVDTDNATATDRIWLYLNGSKKVADTSPSLGATLGINQGAQHELGRNAQGANRWWDGHFAQACFKNGVSLQQGDYDITNFYDSGPVDVRGIGFSGTNEFLLEYGNSSSLGEDSGSGGNDWTPTNIDSSNQSTDVPT